MMRSPMHVLVVMALLIPGAVMAAPIKHEDVARTSGGLSRFVSPDVDQLGTQKRERMPVGASAF